VVETSSILIHGGFFDAPPRFCKVTLSAVMREASVVLNAKVKVFSHLGENV
jgi:hypothetical protein